MQELRNDFQEFEAEFDELLKSFDEDPKKMKKKHDFWKVDKIVFALFIRSVPLPIQTVVDV